MISRRSGRSSPIIAGWRCAARRDPACGTRVVAPPPEAATGTPFGPRLHAVAPCLKTFQALSYERLQGTLSDLFGLRLSQGGLMNLLRRARAFRERAGGGGGDAAPSRDGGLGRVRIEGSNACHWVFRSPEAVVHHAAPTRAAAVVRTMMDGHRRALWLSDRYAAQQGHAAAQQTCLAHLARDIASGVEASDAPVSWRLQIWLNSVFALSERVTSLAASTLAAKRRALDRQLAAILATVSTCDLARALQGKISRARGQLLTLLDHPGAVEATNNACERAPR